MSDRESYKEVTFGNDLHGITCGTGNRGPVIITHGAGKGMDSSILVKTADRLAGMGFVVLRFNFGYLKRRSAPSAGGKKELPELFDAIDFMKHLGTPILIGKSFGARVIANASVERPQDVHAVAFYGMPLQGMSKTSKPRDWSHLAKIKAPMLFITGDKDSLCPLDRLSEVLKDIKAPLESKIVPGDHSFKPKSEDAAVELCTSWVDGLK